MYNLRYVNWLSDSNRDRAFKYAFSRDLLMLNVCEYEYAILHVLLKCQDELYTNTRNFEHELISICGCFICFF